MPNIDFGSLTANKAQACEMLLDHVSGGD